MTGQHITASARHGLPLTTILGFLLTGTEVYRWPQRHARPKKRSLDRMSRQGINCDTSPFNAEATRPALAESDITLQPAITA